MKIFTIALLFMSLTSCSKLFFAVNTTKDLQSLQLNCIKCQECWEKSDFKRFEQKNIMVNVNLISDSNNCYVDFQLKDKTLQLSSLMSIPGIPEKNVEEKILIWKRKDQVNNVILYDTLLYKTASGEIMNNFSSKGKVFNLIGKKTYVFYFK